MNNLKDIFTAVLESRELKASRVNLEIMSVIYEQPGIKMLILRTDLATGLEMDIVDAQISIMELATRGVIVCYAPNEENLDDLYCRFTQDTLEAISLGSVESIPEKLKEHFDALRPELKNTTEKIINTLRETIETSMKSIKDMNPEEVKAKVGKKAEQTKETLMEATGAAIDGAVSAGKKAKEVVENREEYVKQGKEKGVQILAEALDVKDGLIESGKGKLDQLKGAAVKTGVDAYDKLDEKLKEVLPQAQHKIEGIAEDAIEVTKAMAGEVKDRLLEEGEKLKNEVLKKAGGLFSKWGGKFTKK